MNEEVPLMTRLIMAVIGAAILCSSTILAQSPERTISQPAATPEPEYKDSALKFDFENVETSANPCDDFYEYACGRWSQTHPRPLDRPRWSNFTQLTDRNVEVLRRILEKARVAGSPRSSILQKVGDFYGACMDQKEINRRRYGPIESGLKRIAAIKSRIDFIQAIAENRVRYGSNVPFVFGAMRGFHDPGTFVAFLDQGGLTVPDPSFYLSDTQNMDAGRQLYLKAVEQEFALIGHTPYRAAQEAAEVFRIEKELARASTDLAARRDLRNRDHKMTVSELERLAPHLHFRLYFGAARAPAFRELNVVSPRFFEMLDSLLQSIPLSSWKTYLIFHLVRASSPLLSEEIEQANFRATQMFAGPREMPPRWRRCTDATAGALPDALGQLFVEETFLPGDQASILKMVNALESELRSEISGSSWMADSTRIEALAKLSAVRKEIGYPSRWRSYRGLKILRQDFFGNSMRAGEFESNRVLESIGKPVNRMEWNTPAYVVDAVNSGDQIVFPAGLLQPPFFDRSADDAVNYGSIGVLIGHELTHIFDDQGRRVDSMGSLRDWWSDADSREFDRRAGCILDEYNSFIAIDNLKLNGRLSLGENIADNGGARAALRAFHQAMDQSDSALLKSGEPEYDQRFFLAFAQTWCEDATPASLRARLQTSSHSPPRWRVNGVVQNLVEFRHAFHCQEGQPMVRTNACGLW